uniref:Transcription initiation factor TFIID subunit 12 n=2 Tax=Gasterosteus aculeatus aculeatus TaxID=481459 RepID=A0AAQ4RIQ6_GASAC
MFFLCFMNCESNEFVIRVVDACCSSARVQQGAEQSRRVSTGSVTAQSGSGGKDDLANFPSCAEALLGNLLALKSLVVVATRRPKHGQIVFLSSDHTRKPFPPPPTTFLVATSMANSIPAAVKVIGTPGPAGRSSPEGSQVLSKKKLQDLVREIDPNEQLDEDVEEMLLQIADDFIESVVTAACQLARHRKSNTLEVKDVQLHLERQWNMWIPGYGSDEIRPFKKACTTEAHKQRMALIRKTTKK